MQIGRFFLSLSLVASVTAAAGLVSRDVRSRRAGEGHGAKDAAATSVCGEGETNLREVQVNEE